MSTRDIETESHVLGKCEESLVIPIQKFLLFSKNTDRTMLIIKPKVEKLN